MNKNNSPKRVTIPASIIMDKASRELNAFIETYMEQSGIPAELMIHAVKDVLLNLTQQNLEKVSTDFINLQTQIVMSLQPESDENKQED
nr:hypothetical protein [uncultured Schaedlerella sp.]